MRKIIALAFGILATAAAAAAPAPQDGKALATGICSACHGPEGRSVSPVFPRLAGQQPAYIVLQLDAFRGHLRGDPNAQAYMWGMASQLSEDTIRELADYYAAQKPVQGRAVDAALVAAGEKIFTAKIPAQGVPACAGCHGAARRGHGRISAPRWTACRLSDHAATGVSVGRAFECADHAGGCSHADCGTDESGRGVRSFKVAQRWCLHTESSARASCLHPASGDRVMLGQVGRGQH